MPSETMAFPLSSVHHQTYTREVDFLSLFPVETDRCPSSRNIAPNHLGEEHQVVAPRDNYDTPLVSFTDLPSPLLVWSCPYCHCRCPCAGQFAGQEIKFRKSSSQRTGSVLRSAAAKFFKSFGRRHRSHKKSSQRGEPALNENDHARDLDHDCERLSELPTITDTSIELPAREPGEPGEPLEPVELAGDVPPSQGSTGPPKSPAHYQQENPDTTSRLHCSFQDTQKPASEAGLFIPAVDTRVPAQSFTSDRAVISNRTTQVPSMASMSASMTRFVPDEKEVVITQNSSGMLTTPSCSSYKYDARIGRHQEAASWVDDLARVVHELNERWMKTLNDIFPLPVIDTYFGTISPFETGIQVLQRCFRSPISRNIPGTLREIFHLLRIAFAAASLLHHEEEPCYWNPFFDNVLQWGEMIADTHEKGIFVKAVALLYPPNWPKVIYSRIRCTHHSWMASSQVSPGQKAAEQISGATPLTQGPAWYEPTPRSSVATQNAIVQPLVQGPVITVCTQYLDYIEHTNIRAQILAKVSSLSFSFGEDSVIQIIERVLNPLKRLGEFGLFHDHLIFCLRNGLLQNLRGVEIMLKFDQKPILENTRQSAYNEFCDKVSFLCDAMMHGLGPRWRHQYYATELDAVLGVSMELAKKHRRVHDAASQWKLCGKMPTLDSMIVPVCDSPSSTGSDTTILTPDSSSLESVAASVLSPCTSLSGRDFVPWTHDFSSISSPIAPPSSSPRELPNQPFPELPNAASPLGLQPSHMDSLRCELCSQIFTGKLRDQRTNLKRHNKTCHDRIPKYKCSKLNCSKAYTRSDYLQKHYRKLHSIEDQPTRKILRPLLQKPVNS